MYRIGIIGVGFIGAAHIEALRRFGNNDVVALADSAGAEEKAKALNVPKGYADYRELIDTEKPDVIHVCTPNQNHYEVAMYAMERGIHVLCEKPLATTLAEAEELCAAAKEYGVLTGVNLINRFYPLAYEMREKVRAGNVGRIFTIHGAYLQDWLFLETDYNWRLEPEQSGISRAIADIGSHWCDLMEFVTGQRITAVMADLVTFHKTRKKPLKPVQTYANMMLTPEDYTDVPITTEDYAAFLFETDGGAHGSCMISQVFAGKKNQLVLNISGDKSSLTWDSEDSNTLWLGRRDGPNEVYAKDPSILSDGTRRWMDYPGGHVEGYPDAIKQDFKAFYRALDEKNLSGGDFADFEAGRREMLLCEKLVESSRERRWIEV
ncbi:MAG: Gfo/Idh/MocA family oxidoreductase [Clostridiales Family XIII bacterium]|jgi:predicted dehydrogenase|nr:Gfo/Idh/MocA family oxidoreductase [Clostridiales Family XIII bacterium]